MMARYRQLAWRAVRAHWVLFVLMSGGFFALYYLGLLLMTMVRFGEIPNYLIFHDVIHVYRLIWEGTPSITDMVSIAVDEAWIETGYKDPEYYGVATWSYMLVPPKMLLVLLMGVLLGLFAALQAYRRTSTACVVASSAGWDRGLIAAAGLSSAFIALTSATLTWVVCCATPTWIVALTMLGMSASLALWLEPAGIALRIAAFAIMAGVLVVQLRSLERALTKPASLA